MDATAAKLKPEAGGALPRYPMIRSGGLFLLLIGSGVVGGTLLASDGFVNEQVFFLGLGAAVLSLLGARWVSFGRGTPLQLVALFAALGLQAILLVAAARVLGPMSEDQLWYRTMVIVGLHFLPMSVTFGPRMLLLGIACIANGALGFLVPAVPFTLVALVDGTLKIAVGTWMFLTKREHAVVDGIQSHL